MDFTKNDEPFTGTCPTCGQRDYAAEIERLHTELMEVKEAWHGRCAIIDMKDDEIKWLRGEVARLTSDNAEIRGHEAYWASPREKFAETSSAERKRAWELEQKDKLQWWEP